LRRSGPCWSPSATSSARSSGDGRAPTRCWARPGPGGKKAGRNPTDRGKMGTKKSLLTDGDGGPLGVVIAGANAVEQKQLQATIEAVVVDRPDPEGVEQPLCLDAGYDNPKGREAVEANGYVGHIRPSRPGRGEKKRPGRRKARRWAVERTFGWLSKCRGIPVRYEKKDTNYLGLIRIACGLYWYRRLHRIGGTDITQEVT
jgi:putative transposase